MLVWCVQVYSYYTYFIGIIIRLHIISPTLLFAQYELKLVASDNRNENHTTVVIHVKDVNDNPPMFDRPLYETQITEEDDRSLPKNILTVSVALKSLFSLLFCTIHLSVTWLH